MVRIYGATHALADFFGRLTQGGESSGASLLRPVVEGLKRLDAVQRHNPLVTLNLTTGGGVWVIFGGLRYLMILPAQKWLRVVSDDHDGRVSAVFDEAATLDQSSVKDTTGKNRYRQWSVYPAGLETLWHLIETLPRPSSQQVAQQRREHRYFAGAIREAALSQFEMGGRICPGVELPRGAIRPHKVSGDMRIEFDHILPHSRGGSRGQNNCQILCESCNRMKGAKAY